MFDITVINIHANECLKLLLPIESLKYVDKVTVQDTHEISYNVTHILSNMYNINNYDVQNVLLKLMDIPEYSYDSIRFRALDNTEMILYKGRNECYYAEYHAILEIILLIIIRCKETPEFFK